MSKRPFKERVAAFMYGRNGNDALNFILWTLLLVIVVVHLFVHSWVSWILSGIEILLATTVAFRFFSKNPRRKRENALVLNCFSAVRRRTVLMRHKWRDRKTHVYKKCPKCKQVLRLPRVSGEHTAKCPCCGNCFGVRI